MDAKGKHRPGITPLVAVVGDDLSGVVSVSGELASRDLATVVRREPHAPLPERPASAGMAVAVNTDSRHDPPDVAREKVLAASRMFSGDGSSVLVKKVDSLLRGNVGPELAAAMEGADVRKALCIFAAPSQGRTTVGGEQLVDGEPVGGHDPGSYLRSGDRGASAIDLLREEFGDRVSPVGLDVVESGLKHIQGRLEVLLAEKADSVIVCDATKTRHVTECVSAGLSTGFRLFAGTSDLCGNLADALIYRGALPPPLPVLTVSGTASQRGRFQVEQAASQGAVRLVDVRATSGDPSEHQRRAHRATELLRAGENTIVYCAGSPDEQHVEASPAVARALARVAVDALRRARVRGVVATGGETAQAVLDLLDATDLAVGGEIVPGIPETVVLDGPHAGLRFVAKTGAYGGPDALVEIAGWLRSRNGLFEASVGGGRTFYPLDHPLEHPLEERKD